MVQARALICSRDLAIAGEVWKGFSQQIKRAVHSQTRSKRPEVVAAILIHSTRDQDSGIGLPPRDLDVGVSLVIFEANIVTGPVPLNEIGLKNQGLEFRIRDDEFQVSDISHNSPDLRILP